MIGACTAVVCGSTGFIGYELGHNFGELNGYLRGRKDGLEQGYENAVKSCQPEILVKDFNRDGLPDLFVGTSSGAGYLSLDVNDDGAQDLVELNILEIKKINYGKSRCIYVNRKTDLIDL